jgi:hypothetical protein
MINPNLQGSLFSTQVDDVLKFSKFSKKDIFHIYKLGYISFDISLLNELNDSQVLEIKFISNLLNSGIKVEICDHFLSRLEKPYAYDFESVYFDVFNNEWKYLPISKSISDYSFEEILDELIDTSDEKTKIDTILEFIDELKFRLKNN